MMESDCVTELAPPCSELQISKMFGCKYCPKQFRQNRTLQLHTHRCHKNQVQEIGQFPFSEGLSLLCDNCGESFPLHSILVDHIKRAHPSHREFKCRICLKNFKSSTILKIHERVHTGEKPYQCPHCKFSFAQSAPLKQHIMSKHNGLKPYNCEYCDLRFANQSTRRQHLAKSHTDSYLEGKSFLCRVCWLNFELESELLEHTNERHGKYKCKICAKQLSQKCHLKEHLLGHAGIQPFPCPVCDTSFLRRKQLLNHMAQSHPKNTDPIQELKMQPKLVVEFQTTPPPLEAE